MAYDTTATMSSDRAGLQDLLRKEVPLAIYTPQAEFSFNICVQIATDQTLHRSYE